LIKLICEECCISQHGISRTIYFYRAAQAELLAFLDVIQRHEIMLPATTNNA
jgi:hypothetical protein